MAPARAFSFGYSFEEEGYVNLWPAYTEGTLPVQFSLQHYYLKGNIFSANMRGGVSIKPWVRVYADFLYHGSDESQIRMMEPEGKLYLTPLIQKNGKPFSLSLALGASYPDYGDYYALLRGPLANRKLHFSVEVPATRKLGDHLDLTVAPMLITSDGQTVSAISTGVRIIPIRWAALVGEVPILMNNPYDYLQPWAVGIQVHVGPHSVTGFVTNVGGFTLANVLKGTDDRFFGFRFTL
jgi:hypothetical protein